MVLASGGNVVDGSQYTELAETGTQKKRIKPEKAKLPLVPAHLMGTDVSGVKQKSTIFDGCVFCILPAPRFRAVVLLSCAADSVAAFVGSELFSRMLFQTLGVKQFIGANNLELNFVFKTCRSLPLPAAVLCLFPGERILNLPLSI